MTIRPVERTRSDAFTDILRIVGRGRKLQRDLTYEEAREAARLLLSEPVSDAQIGAFLVTMRVKEETADEIRGFAQGAREQFTTLLAPDVEGLVDLALPYDGKAKHLQTGVAAALVLANAGVPVLLHGADDIPTKCGVGPLNLLRALDYPVDLPPEAVERRIERTGFGVLNIASVLPRWTDLTPLRHHFGLRTWMNTVEKLLNPASAPIHINGFFHGSYLQRMADALPGRRANWIVQGEEGSVDMRSGKKTRVYRAEAGAMAETMIDAADYGFPKVHPLEMPNDPQAHAAAIRCALAGEDDPALKQIALTAGGLLWMTGAVPDINAGLEIAFERLQPSLLERITHSL